jgi:hypothetical protein
MGKILTNDNLIKRKFILVDWCCMCKCSGETTDCLLLHCAVAKVFWTFLFLLFGVKLVMPQHVVVVFCFFVGKEC